MVEQGAGQRDVCSPRISRSEYGWRRRGGRGDGSGSEGSAVIAGAEGRRLPPPPTYPGWRCSRFCSAQSPHKVTGLSRSRSLARRHVQRRTIGLPDIPVTLQLCRSVVDGHTLTMELNYISWTVFHWLAASQHLLAPIFIYVFSCNYTCTSKAGETGGRVPRSRKISGGRPLQEMMFQYLFS